MAEDSVVELTPEEAARLASVEGSADALSALIEDLSSSSRRTRQLAARVVNLLAQRDPHSLCPALSSSSTRCTARRLRPVGRFSTH